MDIRLSGHQVDTGDALRQHVSERLSVMTEKLFPRALSSQVTMGRGPHDVGFTCDIVFHVMQGVVLKGSGRAADAHVAVDGAADKIEKQLRRYSRRLKDRNSAGPQASVDDAGYTVFVEPEAEEVHDDFPPVIAETRVDVPDATVSDAVMMLDLRNTNALLFRNTGTGIYNMVYRRGDGTIGWVEPNRAG
ncbi:ribosome-associated translation inhibitor RaiA [Sphingomonas sp.]|uniref:ribosome hibernation-promoting factor, HPF/YfiA family n=1 Tax=Sphingomonas sp. TaxID=28214 RepID=UPI001D7DCB08|nr:ribosome-associated translation inhibitor RaiA [Sphingomonas sp.]MBX9795521.1 ribosome-associated translation inhibitor RaiA [Sphingomonas sp.]